jgi:protein-S-isoprenylcysteine O-methyltransferase Ste14
MTEIRARPGRLPLPPILYLSAIALAVILHWVYPLPWLGWPLSDILFAAGALAIVASVALLFISIRMMTRAGTTLDPNGIPEHLLTKGPFSFTRNPIYLGNTLMMIGIGLVSGILWFLLLAVLAAFLTQKMTIEREEKVLAEKFGKRYRDYSKRVRRWI